MLATCTRRSKTKSGLRWECTQWKAFDCKRAVSTGAAVQTVHACTEHSYEPSDCTVAAAKLKVTMKQHAIATRGKPTQILADNAVTIAVDVCAALGRTASVKRTIRNHKKCALPKDPPSLRKLLVGGERTLIDDKPFLIHDSGHLADNYILVFSTYRRLTTQTRS